MIQFQNTSCETAENVSQVVLEVLSKCGLMKKNNTIIVVVIKILVVIRIARSNTNIFTKLKSMFDIYTFGTDSVAHTTHSGSIMFLQISDLVTLPYQSNVYW